MRRNWLLLSILATFLLALPAQAGKLLFWRFESNNNRLVFTTDERVQPTAQLVPNPTRVVIDLPGIVLGRPSVTQAIGSTVRSVRVGQFDSQTTRIVIELAPGYIVDPQQVKIRGLSPTQWTVELPAPERLPQNQLPPAANPDLPQSQAAPTFPSSLSSSSGVKTTPGVNPAEGVQVTRNGLYVSLDRNGDNQSIKKKRVKDDQFLEFTLPGATLPGGTGSRSIAVNQYGVVEIQLEQISSSPPEAKLTLQLTKDSTDWDAIYSRLEGGGVVLLPRGGTSQFSQDLPNATSIASNSEPNQPPNAMISALELSNSDRQLLIRSDRPIQGQGRWNGQLGVYEMRIPNAQLSSSFRGPQLGRNSPIYQLRIRQETANTIVVLVQPALGTQFGNLTQPSTSLLALEIQPLRGQPPPRVVNNLPAPLTPSTVPRQAYPSNPLPRTPKTGLLVVIDPGHGGQDPGAIGLGGLQEKNIILPISLEVSKFLEQQGIRVLLTRNSDYFVSLEGRTDMANQASADLFVSIHANSMGMGRPDVSGLEVYYFGDPGLAQTIQRSILRTVNIQDRGVRRARFYVLRNSRMPSTLVEVGFVTGNEDAAKLQDSAYLRQMAQAIARGILEYIQQNRS